MSGPPAFSRERRPFEPPQFMEIPIQTGQIFPNEAEPRDVPAGSMKIHQKSTLLAALAFGIAQTPLNVRAEAAPEAAAEAAPVAPPTKITRHLALCAMLGLQVGRTYEFVISNNNDVHYWTIRSLGDKGWILARDSRYAATWVNLSQVIAVTPVYFNEATERPKKANRTR